jgi:hypothetical protein
MSTSVARAESARYENGQVVVRLHDGVEMRFPVSGNGRLSGGTAEQLNRIEISPYGLHWPDLDEDLSFSGLLAGDYGQDTERPCSFSASTTEGHP